MEVYPLPIREMRPARRRFGWLRWLAFGLVSMLVVGAGAGWVAARRIQPWLRARIVDELGQRFQAHVELDGFRVWFSDGLWAEGQGLRIWPPASVVGIGVPNGGNPLIGLTSFSFHAPLVYRPGQPIHINTIELHGLTIDLPPRTHFELPAGSVGQPAKPSMFAAYLHFQVDAMECNQASLTLETSKPGKLPMTIPIERLRLTRAGDDGQLGFEAALTNPRPVGQVRTSGTLGPWKTADPGETPITGQFRLEHADLGTIPGILGTLDAEGQYQGTLRDLSVQGETRTPNFALAHFGTALPLQTRFRATVDATDGDTWLAPVEARLGNSHLHATGAVVRVFQDGRSVGHDIHLNVDVDAGRIEDFLRLTSHSGQPLLTGTVALKNSFDLAPGPAPIYERLKLKGAFVLDQVLFTSDKLQKRIDELSARGQGAPKTLKAPGADARSAMNGSFSMVGGVINLPDLQYTVPGATLALKGNYGVEGGALDFAGTAKLQAKVSQMVGGWQGMLLKPLDGLFSKGSSGTQIPIRISGTRENPDFGADLGPFKFDSQQHGSHKH